MTLSSKIRIYDLARELKVDTKRLIEEIRSEGADVSVPSNAISKGLAESIRIKYFPKKEAIAKRATQAAKKAKGPPRSQIVVIEPKKTPIGNQKERAIVCVCETCGAIALSKSKLNTHSLNAHGKSQRKTFTTKLHSPTQQCRSRNCTQTLREKEKKNGGFCYAHYLDRHQPTVQGMVQGGSPGLRKKKTLRIGKSRGAETRKQR